MFYFDVLHYSSGKTKYRNTPPFLKQQKSLAESLILPSLLLSFPLGFFTFYISSYSQTKAGFVSFPNESNSKTDLECCSLWL